jgi:Domain of unknown function (DUF4166)
LDGFHDGILPVVVRSVMQCRKRRQPMCRQRRNAPGPSFRSSPPYLSPSPNPYHYRERFFMFTYEQELPIENANLFHPVRRGWLLGIPLPGFLLPKSRAREYDLNGTFHFDVGLYSPLTSQMIVRYEGHFAKE